MEDYRRPIGLRTRDIVIAYSFLRIIFGVNFFNHGFTRLGNIPGFAQSMVDLFKDTFMPAGLVYATGIFVPPVEFIIGVLLLLGLANRVALIIGFCLMLVLHYGVTLLQNWDAATSQLIYCLIFFVLLAGDRYNQFSLDAFIRHRRQAP